MTSDVYQAAATQEDTPVCDRCRCLDKCGRMHRGNRRHEPPPIQKSRWFSGPPWHGQRAVKGEVFRHTCQQRVPALIACRYRLVTDRGSWIVRTLQIHEELPDQPEERSISLTCSQALPQLLGQGPDRHTNSSIRRVNIGLGPSESGAHEPAVLHPDLTRSHRQFRSSHHHIATQGHDATGLFTE